MSGHGDQRFYRARALSFARRTASHTHGGTGFLARYSELRFHGAAGNSSDPCGSKGLGCDINLDDITYYVGRETVVSRADGKGLPKWEELIFAAMERNAAQVTDFFRLPWIRWSRSAVRSRSERDFASRPARFGRDGRIQQLRYSAGLERGLVATKCQPDKGEAAYPPHSERRTMQFID